MNTFEKLAYQTRLNRIKVAAYLIKEAKCRNYIPIQPMYKSAYARPSELYLYKDAGKLMDSIREGGKAIGKYVTDAGKAVGSWAGRTWNKYKHKMPFYDKYEEKTKPYVDKAKSKIKEYGEKAQHKLDEYEKDPSAMDRDLKRLDDYLDSKVKKSYYNPYGRF